jgi:hypothetical protein
MTDKDKMAKYRTEIQQVRQFDVISLLFSRNTWRQCFVPFPSLGKGASPCSPISTLSSLPPLISHPHEVEGSICAPSTSDISFLLSSETRYLALSLRFSPSVQLHCFLSLCPNPPGSLPLPLSYHLLPSHSHGAYLIILLPQKPSYSGAKAPTPILPTHT